MCYLHYTEDDFFHDPKFRKWVLQPDPELNYFWERWIMNHPEKKNQVKLARRLIKTVHIVEYNWNSERKSNLWQKINKTLIYNNSIGRPKSNVVQLNHNYKRDKRSTFKSTWFRAAVGSLLILVSIYFFSEQLQTQTLPKQAESNIIEKFNPKGQKSKVFLPDGSVVYLNSASKLWYQRDFNDEQRLVQLEGEAYFEIAKDTLKPFIVKAGAAKAIVLGTSFNVKAFPGRHDTKIALVEGQLKVATNNDNTSVILTPGQSATLNNNNNISTGAFDYLSEIAWKDGILYFNNTSLQNAFDQLEKWYGVKFHSNLNPDSKILITGKFENEYLTNVLKSLSYSVRFEYSIENGNIVNINFK
ncbi:MAG: FecR family protein [Cyclobacteriaceae bacterium]